MARQNSHCPVGSSPWGRGRKWGSGRPCQAGGRGTFPRFLRGSRSGQVAGQPLPSPQKDHRATLQRYGPVVCGSYEPRGTLPPSRGSGHHRRALRRVRKTLASRYYQLLSAIGSFLHERMTGPQRLESSVCWWRNWGRGSGAVISFLSVERGPSILAATKGWVRLDYVMKRRDIGPTVRSADRASEKSSKSGDGRADCPV